MQYKYINRNIYGKATRRELNYKTVMCTSWLSKRRCSYGDHCRFAHGSHELRWPPDAMPVRRKTQLCKKYTLDGICPFGRLCKFIHPTPASATYQQPRLAPIFPMGYLPFMYGVQGTHGAFDGPQYYAPATPPNPNFAMPVAKKCESGMSDSLHACAPKPSRPPLVQLGNHTGGYSAVNSQTVMTIMKERSRITPSAPPLESAIWSPEKRNRSAESSAIGKVHDQAPLGSFDDPSVSEFDSPCDVDGLAKRISELDVISKSSWGEPSTTGQISQQKNSIEAATPVARPRKDRPSRGPFSMATSSYWKD